MMQGPEDWNINTEEGMNAAIFWMENVLLPGLKDMGTWAVPRAMSAYEIDKQNKVVTRLIGDGDQAVERVFKAMGWIVDEISAQ